MREVVHMVHQRVYLGDFNGLGCRRGNLHTVPPPVGSPSPIEFLLERTQLVAIGSFLTSCSDEVRPAGLRR